jgi:hypothetical protein
VRPESLDIDERVVLLNAMEEGLVSELRHECQGDARRAFERLWRAGLVGLYSLGSEHNLWDDDAVSAAIGDPGLWDGTDPTATTIALVATDAGISVFTGKSAS